jgi:hypothetical protein
VGGLGWLGLAQPMWAELGPAQKIKKIIKIKIKKGRKNKINKKYVCINKK